MLKKLQRFKNERLFKLKHPDPSERSSLEKEWELFQSLGDPNLKDGEYTEEQMNLFRVMRKEQMIDTGTGQQSNIDPNKFFKYQFELKSNERSSW